MANKLFSRILVVTLIPVSLYMIYIAGSWGLADIYYRPAMNELKSWRSGKVTLEDKDWDRLRIKLSRALELDSDNPEIHENLALAIEGRFINTVSKDANAEPSRQLALEHYRKSVLLRPIWPYAWAGLISVKYRLGQFDDEFYEALHTVERLGPWEPGLQRLIAVIGLNEWNVFPIEEKKFVLEVISRALEKQPYKILPIIKRKGFLELICFINQGKSNVVEYCEKNKKVKAK